MKTLYHGTIERIAKLVPRTGIVPEAVSTITLTNIYGAFQAFSAIDPTKNEKWGIIEILVDNLKKDFLQPCDLAYDWKKSLEGIGFCLYGDRIPVQAISKIWTYEPSSNWLITRTVLDTQIGITHYKKDFNKLSLIQNWLTGNFVDPNEWLNSIKNSIRERILYLEGDLNKYLKMRHVFPCREIIREIIAELRKEHEELDNDRKINSALYDRNGLDLFYSGTK